MVAVRSEEEIGSAFFSKGGGGREGGREERKIRLTVKESASASKWLENEGISGYAEAAVMFEGATNAAEREKELLRKQWPAGDIGRVAGLCKTFHSATQVEKIEKWLCVRARSDERELRELPPGKSARRSTSSRPRESDRAARSRSRTSEGEDSLWESAIRLRSGASD